MREVVIGIAKKTDLKQDYYLLISSNKDFGEYTGFYYPPGGHKEKNESESETLVREFSEELNAEIIPIRKICYTGGDVKEQITHWWEVELISDKIKLNTDELSDADWFSREEMQKLNIWPSTKNFFENHIFNAD